MAVAEIYDVGDAVELTGTFTNAAGDPADPTTATCKVLKPDGTSQVVTVSKTALGVFTGTYTITQSGTHWYRFTGTGAVVAAGERQLKVRPQRVT